ncbi:hypothetical protein B566_EDAN010598 [Ephemera danica]|nr:hypothetical protein B566_EDAN010598 [Ephemera danica]
MEQQGVFNGLHSLCQAAVALLAFRTENSDEKRLETALTNVLACPPAQLPSDTQYTCAMALALVVSVQDDINPLIWPALEIKPPSIIPSISALMDCELGIRVSLCSALLNATSPVHLTRALSTELAEVIGTSTLLQAIFKFLVVHTARSTEPQLLLGGSRALAGIGRVLTSLEDPSEVLGPILSPALEHCLGQLEHHMDSVRHTARALLDSLLTAAEGTIWESEIVASVQLLPEDRKARFAGVTALASRLGVRRVLDELPGLVPWLLDSSQHFATAPHAVSALEVLMQRDVGESDASRWRNVLNWERLSQALEHAEDEVRLQALGLLIESRKPTEALTSREPELLLLGLAANGDSHAPATLHRTIGLLKKLLTRLESSLRGLQRRQETTSHYPQLVSDLCDVMFLGLFPGASLGRRSLSLHALTLLHELPGEPWSAVWATKFSSQNARALLDCLRDSYENNKQTALALLATFPAVALGFHEETRVRELLNHCLALARLAACQLLVSRLQRQLDIARRSILQAAARGPMYGTLFCLRHLLTAADLSRLAQLEEGPQWRALIDELVETCFQLNAVVAPVVNSSSPEGHLPMDFESGLVTDDGDDVKVTAQMVLLCSWRTVKEVSLLLGDLASAAPANQQSYLLSKGQLIAIGEHLTSLLCETKHRGAFEQAYVGFCRLSAWLWRVPTGELPQLPAKWLEELLEAITCEEVDSDEAPRLAGKLCATRRSAGVPFIVQALVSTELEVRERPECFPGAMSRLLSLAALSGCPGQVHALNILRTLFRSAQLGEYVAPYVASGFAVALRAFRGDTWAERNAATLLFSALMGRVFGVKHTPGHEALPRKNRMTGRIFFRLYPGVFELLERELREAATLIVSQSPGAQLTPGLHPALLLLARLYPSSLEGTDTSLNLLSLRASTVACAGSPVLHTRVLAAKALVPLVDPSSLSDFLTSLSLTSSQPHNLLHGTLLQLTFILEVTESSSELDNALQKRLEEGLPLLQPERVCAVTKTAFVSLLEVVLTHHPSCLSEELFNDVTAALEITLFTPACIGYSVLKQKCAQVLLLLSPEPETPLLMLLHHPLTSVVHQALEFLLSVTPAQGEICGDAAPELGPANCERLKHSELPEGELRLQKLLAMQGRLGSADHMLLACCGELIHVLSFQPSQELISDYCKLLLQNSDEDSSLGSRLVTAQSLCRNQDKLLSSSPRTVCQVHCIAMRLLQDCNENVRMTVAQMWPSLARVVRTNATKLVATSLVDTLGSSHPKDHERVFDKGDIATSSEELKVTEAACDALKYFMGQVPEETVTQALEQPLDWLPLSQDPPSVSCSLKSLFSNIVMPSPPHFLHPEYQRAALDYMRYNCVKATCILDKL